MTRKTCVANECTTPAQYGQLCWRHGGVRRCTEPDCGKIADSRGRCYQHGGFSKCSVEGCTTQARRGPTCVRHGERKECMYPDCHNWARDSSFRCVRHFGGPRCGSEACRIHDPLPPARYRLNGTPLCWGCTAALEPGMVKAKVRTEHLVVDELVTRMPQLLSKAREAQWDCAVVGGCSLKRPDLFYVFEDLYVQIEIDSNGHCDHACDLEDSRLEIIAADVGLPGLVCRVNPSDCIGSIKLRNGEVALRIKEPTAWEELMAELCQLIEANIAQPPSTTVRRYIPGSMDVRSDQVGTDP